VLISCRHASALRDLAVVAEVRDVLARRAALPKAPVSLAVSDAAALGIAGIFSSSTPSGQVLERFYRTGTADSDELIDAARTEQGYASAEGHAALYCLVGWVHARVSRGRPLSPTTDSPTTG
jgi:hypothetical protein